MFSLIFFQQFHRALCCTQTGMCYEFCNVFICFLCEDGKKYFVQPLAMGVRFLWACSSDPLDHLGEGEPPGYQSCYVAEECLAWETCVAWFTRSPKELMVLQNEQENPRLDLLGCSPDFIVTPLDESNDSVSLSVTWKSFEEWMRSSKQKSFSVGHMCEGSLKGICVQHCEVYLLFQLVCSFTRPLNNS